MLGSEEENEGQSVKMLDSELEKVSATISQSMKASEEGDSELAEQDDEELLEPELHLAAQRELSPTVEEGGSCTDEMSSASGGEEPMFEESSLATPDGSQVKGILRMADKAKHNKRIVFDPLVLFLDGALEGELETVVENSSKITDVSMPNDEGITALHNAICAGHHEIVTYLVDNHADVNAADSDGWTPLHCAASCNNLPMVKLLVENGACVFATTLSDSETPARKCEEGEDGYESCAQYLEMADKCAGIVNEKTVYAAYDYDAEREDELSFEEGDALRVLERDGKEKLWWLCEKLSTGAQGFAPRNYLCLYPTWRHRERNNFKHFELPKLPTSASPLKRSLSNDDIPRSKEQKTDVWDSGHNVLAQA
ncbi:p53BP2 [Aphelenchoides avenae]|nr:p53BP2 [Aphelenchus avenae]